MLSLLNPFQGWPCILHTLQVYNYPDHDFFKTLAVTGQWDSSAQKKEFEKHSEYCENSWLMVAYMVGQNKKYLYWCAS